MEFVGYVGYVGCYLAYFQVLTGIVCSVVQVSRSFYFMWELPLLFQLNMLCVLNFNFANFNSI